MRLRALLITVGVLLMSSIVVAEPPFQDLDSTQCLRVAVNGEPEDMELDRWSREPRLIVASTPPVAVPIVNGKLDEMVTLNAPKFHPIGISLVRNGEKTLLYAISRGVGVEVFELTESTLAHRRTLKDELITSPNGIAATRSGQVYVSNISAHGGLRGRLSNLFRRNSGSVIHYDGRQWTKELSPVHFGNGLLLSPDESQLWVASFTDRKIRRYRRDVVTGKLTHEVTIDIDGHPDNIKWSAFPTLVVAVHPSYTRTGLHITAPKLFKAPTAVAVIHDATAAAPKAEIVVLHRSGKVISGASTTIPYGDRIFLSQIKRGFLIDCPAPQALTVQSQR